MAVDAAWRTATGDGVVIAVIDTGIDGTHPDLAGRLVPGIDLVDGGYRAVDPHGHGTHVAGIAAAATGNDTGISGAAPGAVIMPVRVLGADGTGSDDVIGAGIDWAAANGAHVINLSLGESGFAARLSEGGPLNAAIRRAHERGAVVVAAAGNDAVRERAYRIGVPVLVVNTSTESGEAASFTNTGDLRAVGAPGQDIWSTVPTAPTTLHPEGSDGYAALDGTSMAAPLVAAVAALLIDDGVPSAEVAAGIASTAGNPAGDPALGAGIVDAARALAATGAVTGRTVPRPPRSERPAGGR